mgnify:CR=1 FL=1
MLVHLIDAISEHSGISLDGDLNLIPASYVLNFIRCPQIVQVDLHLVGLVNDGLLEGFIVLFEHPCHRFDCALPLVLRVVLLLVHNSLHNEKELPRLIDNVSVLQNCNKVSDQFKLGPHCVDVLVLHHPVKSVAHDSDQHVQHRN